MSFFTNPAQQMTLDDSTYHLTEREQKALEKSWAKPFAEELFPMHIAGANGHFCGLQRTRSVVTGQVRSSPILNRLIACYFNS